MSTTIDDLWVAVEDGNPEDGQRVIAWFDRSGMEYHKSGIGQLDYFKDKGFDLPLNAGRVTHWQPWPQSPPRDQATPAKEADNSTAYTQDTTPIGVSIIPQDGHFSCGLDLKTSVAGAFKEIVIRTGKTDSRLLVMESVQYIGDLNVHALLVLTKGSAEWLRVPPGSAMRAMIRCGGDSDIRSDSFCSTWIVDVKVGGRHLPIIDFAISFEANDQTLGAVELAQWELGQLEIDGIMSKEEMRDAVVETSLEPDEVEALTALLGHSQSARDKATPDDGAGE